MMGEDPNTKIREKESVSCSNTCVYIYIYIAVIYKYKYSLIKQSSLTCAFIEKTHCKGMDGISQ